ncbi:MAG: glycoside hydrolase family 95 protein, partial [Sedimentisphaerales bacterium]|nr:glycoside hydrolase family 95 protein [Sedimentisphaerales bacterium]
MKNRRVGTPKPRTAGQSLQTLALYLLLFVCLPAACLTNTAKGPASASLAEQEWSSLKLWYNQPAAKWTEALAVGNGRLGAMVFGGTTFERIQLNEDTLWAGPPVPQDRVGAYEHIAEARKLIFEGKYSEAQGIMQREVMGQRISPRSYQTLGNLTISMAADEKPASGAIAITRWRRGGEDDASNDKYVTADYDDSGWSELVVKADSFAKGNPSVEPNKKAVFRSSFELTTEQLATIGHYLNLGPIDDEGTIYVNGKEVGKTNDYSKPYSFDVGKSLKAGKNVVAVVVGNVGGPGGMTSSVTVGPPQDSSGVSSAGSGESYNRRLDLDTAIATTTFEIDGVNYNREVFASPVDQAVVVRLMADKPGSISVEVALDRPADFEVEPVGSDTLSMFGQA